MIHAGLLLVFLTFAGPVMGAIPLAGLAGLLMVVSWKMIEWHAIRALLRIDRAEAGVAGLTFLTVILGDLVTGIIAGTALSGLLFIARMAQDGDASPVPQPPDETREGEMILRLSGPLFFASVARIERVLDRIPEQPRLLVLDLSEVSLFDQSGAQMLAELSRRVARRGGRVAAIGVLPQLRGLLPPDLPHAEDLSKARRLARL